MEKVLTRYVGTPNLWKLETYRSLGGYQTLEKALREYQPDDIVTMVRDSGLRGRGGAGFPTGVKWGFLPKDNRPRYLVCNGDESEPGTFKDRVLIEDDPHQVLEGLIISCYAVHASLAFIYLRGEFFLGAQRLQAAIDEAYAAGYLGKNILGSGMQLDVLVHRGAGAYICGEETGLIESLEGKRAYPRIKPPFPANIGAFGMPTVVNNVETLANVRHIVERGAAWYNSIGPKRDEIREKALDELQKHHVLMLDGHFDFGNGYHGRVYLNPHQLFRQPSTIWRFAQDLLDVLPARSAEPDRGRGGTGDGRRPAGAHHRGSARQPARALAPADALRAVPAGRHGRPRAQPFYARAGRRTPRAARGRRPQHRPDARPLRRARPRGRRLRGRHGADLRPAGGRGRRRRAQLRARRIQGAGEPRGELMSAVPGGRAGHRVLTGAARHERGGSTISTARSTTSTPRSIPSTSSAGTPRARTARSSASAPRRWRSAASPACCSRSRRCCA